jgi:hypothetical protein
MNPGLEWDRDLYRSPTCDIISTLLINTLSMTQFIVELSSIYILLFGDTTTYTVCLTPLLGICTVGTVRKL